MQAPSIHFGAVLEGGQPPPRHPRWLTGRDGQGAVVLAGHGDAGRRCGAGLHALLQHRVLEDLRVLLVLAHIAGQREHQDGEGDQQSEDDAEYVEEVGVVLAHVRVRPEKGIQPGIIAREAAASPARMAVGASIWLFQHPFMERCPGLRSKVP